MQPEDVEWAAWYDPEDPLVEDQLVPGSDAAHDAAVYAASLRRRHPKPPKALFVKMFKGEASKAEKDSIQLWLRQERRIKSAWGSGRRRPTKPSTWAKIEKRAKEKKAQSGRPRRPKPPKKTSQSNRASGCANFDEFGELTEIEFD
jgi:hypothetical protein